MILGIEYVVFSAVGLALRAAELWSYWAGVVGTRQRRSLRGGGAAINDFVQDRVD